MERLRIAQPLSKQSDEVATVAKELLGEGKLELDDMDLFISKAHSNALEEYAAMLEKEESRLTEQLKQTVLELSFRIRVTRMLKNRLYYESGMQDGLISARDIERRAQKDEKATTNTNREDNS